MGKRSYVFDYTDQRLVSIGEYDRRVRDETNWVKSLKIEAFNRVLNLIQKITLIEHVASGKFIGGKAPAIIQHQRMHNQNPNMRIKRL